MKVRKWLKKAEEINVPTDNEKAMLQIQLANIAASKNISGNKRNNTIATPKA